MIRPMALFLTVETRTTSSLR
jgi:hypothetical protein